MSKTKVKINDNLMVNVKSGFFGKLTYVNHKTGDETEWGQFGEIQSMPIADLKAMKSKQIAFYKNQWINVIGVSDDENQDITVEDILNHLYVAQYYKNVLNPENFIEVCNWKIDEIAENVALLSAGAHDNLIVALNDYIQSGQLDSRKKIKAFEEALGCTLIDNE